MITIKTREEIELMRQGGKILAEVLDEVAKKIQPGITTAELNKIAEDLILRKGAAPAFKGYHGFPSALCVSVNEEVVHGVPSQRELKNGDIVGLDLGIIYPPELCFSCPFSSGNCGDTPGLFTDAAITVAVGEIDASAKRLINVAKRALEIGLEQIKPSAYLGDLGFAIQSYVESEGFSIIRDLVGHGVGKELHEEPEIPNFGKAKTGLKLQEGMTLAIEPMVAMGKYHIKKGKDGFAYETADKSLSAHFEHTVVVTNDGCEILTKL